jgi:serine/threonine-protein kinase HipA
MNPTPLDVKAHILTTAINFDDTAASLETAMAVAPEFRLSKDKAHKIIKEVNTAVKKWRTVASEIGLSKRECDRMASAFVTLH